MELDDILAKPPIPNSISIDELDVDPISRAVLEMFIVRFGRDNLEVWVADFGRGNQAVIRVRAPNKNVKEPLIANASYYYSVH